MCESMAKDYNHSVTQSKEENVVAQSTICRLYLFTLCHNLDVIVISGGSSLGHGEGAAAPPQFSQGFRTEIVSGAY